MDKTVFIAGGYAEAAHWAFVWGFEKDEWIYINTRDEVRMRGLQFCRAFVCGSTKLDSKTQQAIEACCRGEMTFIDAHYLDFNNYFYSALELVNG